MDNAQVFLRTPAGEAASAQPTRVVQRHMRTALLLVDGERPVADIVAEFDDVAVAEAALEDLLRARLIETPEMRASRSAAALAPVTASRPQTGMHLPSQVTETDQRTTGGIVETITIDDVKPEGAVPLRDRPLPPMPPMSGRRPASVVPPAAAPVAMAAAPVAMAAPRRKLRATRPITPRTWASTILVLLLVLGLSIVAGMRYYPFERHVAQAERTLSAALGQPVKIGQMSVSFSPYPAMALDHVQIGEGGRVTVDSVRFLPDPLSAFGDRVAIRDVQLDGMQIAAGDVQFLIELLAGNGTDGRIDIRSLQFKDATLRLADRSLSGLEGVVAAGTLRFATSDGALRGELLAADDGLRVRLTGRSGWAPAFAAPLAFDGFDAEGRIEQDAVQFDKVYGRVADGSIRGHAKVMFAGQTRISAELEMKHLSLDKLFALSKAGVLAQGSASGTLRVGGPAVRTEGGSGLVFEGNVKVHNGTLQGFDLVEAVRSSGHHVVRGGATRFEEFAGQVRVEPGAWRISRLRLQSGLLSAEGQIAGGRDRPVAGMVNVELRGSTGSVRVPVEVTGSLKDPVLTASHGARAATAPEPS